MSPSPRLALLFPLLLAISCASSPGERALGVIPAGTHALTEIVDEVAKCSHSTILVEELRRAGAGRIDLQSPIVLNDTDFVETLHNLLFTQQYAIVPVDSAARLYDVVALQGPRRDLAMTTAIQREPRDIRARPESMRFVWCEVPLEIHNATVLVNLLRPQFAQAPYVALTMAATPDDRGVLLRGPQALVAGAIEQIERTNRPRQGGSGAK